MSKKWLILLLAGGLLLQTGCDYQSPNKSLWKTVTKQRPDDYVYTAKPVSYEFQIDTSFEKMAENEVLTLFVNRMDGNLAVGDKRNKSIWYANPLDADADEIAVGDVLTNFKSQLWVTYVNQYGKKTSTNSLYSSVGEGGLKVETLKNGMKLTYTFVRESFSIPLLIELVEDYVSVRIPTEKIQEMGQNKITKIHVLPYFGAANVKDTGFILVPDGCGGIIRYNNGQDKAEMYVQSIYGKDAGLSYTYETPKEQMAHFPVFGRVTGNAGFLAVIHEGDAVAEIRAAVSGYESSYNWAHAAFTYRIEDTVSLLTREYAAAKDVSIFAEKPTTKQDFIMRYYFTGEKKADLNSLAAIYRKYLINEIGLKATENQQAAVVLDFLGAYEKRKTNVLGFPYVSKEVATSFRQAQEILEDFRNNGIDNVTVNYLGALGDGLKKGHLDTQGKISPVLGGKKDFQAFLQAARQMKIPVYINYELLQFSKGSFKANSMFDAAKNVLGVPIEYYSFDIASKVKKPKADYNFSSPSNLVKLAGQLAEQRKTSPSAGISLNSFGDKLYSAGEDDVCGRILTQRAMEEAMRLLNQNGEKILFSQANAYQFPYAAAITAAPISSTGFYMVNEEVPFYQMVLRGLVELAVPPVNQQDDPVVAVLKAVQTGMSLHYTFSYEDASVFKDTDYMQYYGASYRNNRELAIQQVLRVSKVLEKLEGAIIEQYEQPAAGITKTVFSNGVVVWVNFTEKEVRLEECSLQARDFYIEEHAV